MRSPRTPRGHARWRSPLGLVSSSSIGRAMPAGSTIVGWILSPVRQMGKGHWPNSIHSATRAGGVVATLWPGPMGPYGGSTRRPWHSYRRQRRVALDERWHDDYRDADVPSVLC